MKTTNLHVVSFPLKNGPFNETGERFFSFKCVPLVLIHDDDDDDDDGGGGGDDDDDDVDVAMFFLFCHPLFSKKTAQRFHYSRRNRHTWTLKECQIDGEGCH